MLMSDVYVHLIDFPNTTVTEAVTQNEDGSYSIFINAKLSKEKQQYAYAHALRHIDNFDFEKVGQNVSTIEAYAHA